MEREPRAVRRGLIEAVARDYPNAPRIKLNLPGEWEWVERIEAGAPLCVAALPPRRETPSRDHFWGLAPKINRTLSACRDYRFLKLSLTAEVNAFQSDAFQRLRISDLTDLHLRLQPIGEAQVWFGRSSAVLYECDVYEWEREPQGRETLAQLWHVVERDLHVSKIFTAAHNSPTREFLTQLGYRLDPNYPLWWSKASRNE